MRVALKLRSLRFPPLLVCVASRYFEYKPSSLSLSSVWQARKPQVGGSVWKRENNTCKATQVVPRSEQAPVADMAAGESPGLSMICAN